MWTGDDTLLVLWPGISIALVVVLVAWAKVHAFLAESGGADRVAGQTTTASTYLLVGIPAADLREQVAEQARPDNPPSFAITLFTILLFGYGRGMGPDEVASHLATSLAPAAGILLIIGAGGGFKQVLIGSGIGDAIGKAVETADISALVPAWVVAVVAFACVMLLSVVV